MEQRNQKTFFVFKINANAFEPGQQSLIFWNRIVSFAGNMLPSNRRIEISLTEGYSKAGAPRVMKNIMKLLARRFDKSLAPFNMFTVKGCSETVSFRE